ncbi:unnamed protein product [Fusarium fujikuroi]|uniref:ARCA protein n=1 Tax=Fusarium fujikuroi TaxID=5127 RepID=A0A9Q9RV89_FUSFU|nr:unnamed protein product [Fusarium fujikuroi]VTT80371.1 unnamed protein product [Fusarium fujikuroi]VZH95639.1 unnamed protein product [Fusarium fujikuroi]
MPRHGTDWAKNLGLQASAPKVMMKSLVLSVSLETYIVTEASNVDFATVGLARQCARTRRKGLDFPSDQRWCKLDKQKIEFLDQTLDIVRSFNSFSDPEAYPSSSEEQSYYFLERQDEGNTPLSGSSRHDVDGGEHHLTSSTYSHTDTQPQETSNLGHSTLQFHQQSDQLPGLVFDDYTNVTTEQINGDTEFAAQDTYASYGDRYQLRLPTCGLKQDEAELVRHFFSGFSDAFDLGDPDRPFSSWLSTRVLQYPRLLESILTIVSRHFGKRRTNSGCLDSAAEPLSESNPRSPNISSNINCSMEEIHSVVDLLSRFAQSMEVRTAKCLVSSPSLGQANMMDRPTELFERESLPEAAWWANLRMEAYLAVVNQVPFPSYLDSLCADKRGAPVDDKDWANLMLLHLTDIIRYCLSDNKDTEHYAALLKDITIWSETKPDSFDPIYTCNHPEKQVLPDIWLYSEPVAAGLQYYHLSRMLLMSHDPRLPKIGLARNRTMKQIEVTKDGATEG